MQIVKSIFIFGIGSMGWDMKGFTIVEIILVVVILGILAAVAIPKIVGPNEMITSSEGRETLATLVRAQKSYFLDNGTYTNNMANLDVTIPASQFFNAPVALNPGAAGLVARVQRTGGAYTLRISDAGVITCTPSPSVACTSIHCNKNPGGNRCN